ncbi:Predicted thioesterase [Marinitoga hydrogenitolerans DSM 16785]|uniref:Predicted thioesterase n=1 Tax=Marinitoga hydrogenitolerans (strain DSM 16785 / JCM 12826 / AT1271) TaxID=1122195 RepID=A0A1M4X191_MARH1|nr:hotdog domain-containing protein [Marinitoga hydrogenitolerans]SHE86972.1 Predicted thioesterase [Marinitoga hydrogenitolerans DSM 16785]
MEVSWEKIKELEGKEFNYSFSVNDESFLWSEKEEYKDFHLLSTTALLEEIFRASTEILEPYIPEHVAVVSSAKINHIAPTPYGFKVFMKIKIIYVKGNKIKFSADVYDEIEKIAQAEFKKFIVNKNALKRKNNEKSSKLI